ncbi:MAG: cytochrome c biogenesis protein [Coriobacteriia bacterium]|nr:cytochrome c biogenesis protein [Coriobacteriia bacterium]
MKDLLIKARDFLQGREIQIAIVLAVIGGILTTIAFVMAFTTANMQYHTTTVNVPGFVHDTRVPLAPPEFQPQPPDGTVNYHNPWFSQKIFYFHVPIAQLSLLVFTLAAIFSVLFLRTKDPNYDLRSRVAMETTLLFTLGTMISGSLWTRASWINSWGELFGTLLSEPRLVTYSVMLMFVVAYFVLRRSVSGEEKRATYSAVFSILAWIIVPFSFIFTRVTNQVQAHPTDALNPGMDTSNLIPFIICIFGMMMLGYAIYTLRVREEKKRAQIEAIKEDIEDALADAAKAGSPTGAPNYSAAAVLGTPKSKEKK